MKRTIDKGGEATNSRLTDEMIAQANEIVNQNMANRIEDMERECCVWGTFSNMFSINCRTPHDYQDYIFRIENDNSIHFVKMEGDYRD